MTLFRPIRLLALLALLFIVLAGGHARADTCDATMTDISFGAINPVAPSDAYASGTLTVTCTWTLLNLQPPLLLLPAVTVCVDLGAGSGRGGAPRYLANAGRRMAFNLYTDNSYGSASIWGGPAIPGTKGIPIQFAALLKLGSASQSFPIYAKIPASAMAGVGSTGGASTVYTSDFSGQGTVFFAFTGILTQPCTTGGSSTFSFQARATVANDCVINAGTLDFGTNSILNGTRRANASLNVKCTANNPYQISLNGGLHGSVGARRMKNAATGETVGYTLSSTQDGLPWGDGSGGTSIYGGVGNGAVQAVPLHGAVPAQRTPSPGNYSDTVTATLYF